MRQINTQSINLMLGISWIFNTIPEKVKDFFSEEDSEVKAEITYLKAGDNKIIIDHEPESLPIIHSVISRESGIIEPKRIHWLAVRP